MKLLVCFLAAASLIYCAWAQIPGDKITSLPNLAAALFPDETLDFLLPAQQQGNLGIQYSGYVNVNAQNGRYLHYWFVQSLRSSSDPVVLWLNGGPGCSSLDGYLYEHGPYKWNKNFNDTTLSANPWTWASVANVIYLEAPAGVGFSYSNTPSDYTTCSDTRTAEDNFQFLLAFFRAWPQLANNPFYISGESFAGVYVPTLANRILTGNTLGQSAINLKGILVGNGVTNPTASSVFNGLLPFMYGHGLYSTQQQQSINSACNPNPNSPTCQNLINNVQNVFSNLNIYDIYASCYSQRPPINSESHKITPRPAMQVPCVDSHKADIWLNQAAVKSAIHVQQNIKWQICNAKINQNYNHDISDMVPIYHSLIGNGTRILIYSGDTDAAVPFTDTQYWTSQLLGQPLQSLWQPWNLNDQIAGFVTQYSGLTYVTVRGAGHMVPQTRPHQAFVMFSSFLTGTPL